jgi:hypothetical protein
MYVRWQSYEHKKPEPRKYSTEKRRYDVLWRAILVESVRVNGKSRNRHIAYLGGITNEEQKDPERRRRFWKRVLKRLLLLANRVSPEDHAKIIASITKKVKGPIPTREEMPKMDQEGNAFIRTKWVVRL